MSVARKMKPEAAVRDLFDAGPLWEPPKEFSDYLAERKQAKAAAPEVVPAAPSITEPALIAPTPPTALVRRRDFTALVERVVDGRLLVIRTLVTEAGCRARIVNGETVTEEVQVPCYHEYRAFELVGDGDSYGELAPGDAAYGRVDTKHPRVRVDDNGAIEHELARQRDAVKIIGQTCPEASLARDESCVGAGVYTGPGYVRVTTDPETRRAALRAAWRPA